MSCEIFLEDVSLIFRIYHDKGMSLKEFVLNKITRKKFPDPFTEFSALDHFSLRIKEGERLGIIGLNGAGKSTLLKTISQIYEPHKGKVKVKGRIAPLLEIGAGFNPEFTGRENIYLNGAMLGFNKEKMQEKEKDIIEFTDLGHFIDMPVKYYSTGMHSRLAFTIATMVDPEILVIDEIFAGGDGKFIAKGTERMNNLINTSKIVLMVSHNLDIIRSICQRTIIIDKGKLIADGHTEEILDLYYKKVIN